MVANETQEFIFSVLEAQQDFTIKYTIFGVLIVYTILLYFWQKQIGWDSIPKIIFKFCSNIFVYINVFFLPLLTIFLFRGYDAIQFWTLILQVYGIVFVVAAFTLFILGWEKSLSFLGIQVDFAEMMHDKTLKGETK